MPFENSNYSPEELEESVSAIIDRDDSNEPDKQMTNSTNIRKKGRR